VLCPYGVTKGDLKFRASKAPRRAVVTKKFGNLAQACKTGQVSLGNVEPAVVTGVVIITVYRGHEEMVTRRSLYYMPLRSVNISNRLPKN
jgi:hypothetical protein